MIEIFRDNTRYYFFVLLIIALGVFGGFVGATGAIILALMVFNEEERIHFLLASFVLFFILADNFSGPLAFAQNLRFIIIGLSLIVLRQYYLSVENQQLLPIAFSILALLITLRFSPLGLSAAFRSLGYIFVFLCIFKLAQMANVIHRKRTLQLLITLLFIFFAINVLIYFVPIYSGVFLKGRFKGLMGNPNGLGLLSMFCYALLVWIDQLEQTDIPKSLFMVFKILLLFLIVVTASRTALLSILAFELAYRFLHQKILLILGLLVLVFLSILLNNFDMGGLIQSLGLSDYLRLESLQTASGRTEVWAVAFEEFKNSPWFGNGMQYDNYFIADYRDRTFGEFYARHWGGIWNSYLSLGLNVGIIGLGFFIYFWRRLYLNAKDHVFKTAFLVMMMLSAVTESWMAASMNAFMPLVFLIWALQIETPEEEQEKVL